MPTTSFLSTPSGRRIAYHQTSGTGPGIVFLGGFKSDMDGTKAVFLEDWCRSEGRAFLRFDYSGHGQSSEAFTDGAISDWAEDAYQAVTRLCDGPQVLIGSSMGGWIALLLARRVNSIAGMVTIAAAPDFTEDSMWASFDASQKTALEDLGRIELPSEYGEPYVITKRLIEDGRENLVLRAPLELPFPVRFLQGTDDVDVKMSVATRLLEHASGPDMRLVVLKGADHRFSEPDALQLIKDATNNVFQMLG